MPMYTHAIRARLYHAAPYPLRCAIPMPMPYAYAVCYAYTHA